MQEHMFRWDKVGGEIVIKKYKNPIIKAGIKNYDPELSLPAKIKKDNPKTIKITDEKSIVHPIRVADKCKIKVKITEKIDELIVKKYIDKKDNKEFSKYSAKSAQESTGIFAGYIYIILISTQFFLFFAIIIYSSVQFWPHFAFIDGKANSVNPPVPSVTFFGWISEPVYEKLLLLTVVFASDLGNLDYARRFFHRHIDNRDPNELACYVHPFTGYRGIAQAYSSILKSLEGCSSMSKPPDKKYIRPCNYSALAGMFSVQAALKLHDITYSMFEKVGEK